MLIVGRSTDGPPDLIMSAVSPQTSAAMPRTMTAGAAGLALQTKDGRVLLCKRGQGGDHPGEWAFPGGRIEPGEASDAAAIREFAEECGAIPEHVALGAPGLFHRDLTQDGVDFSTYLATVSDEFSPTFNGELTDYRWVSPRQPPQPLHPGCANPLKIMARLISLAERRGDQAHDAALAFDRKTARSYDGFGRLHVSASHISKAVVNPYRGDEIPNSEELGLQPDRIYMLYRDPDELAKAAPTFNNLPILSRHVPVNVFDHKPELVIGSTGTDAAFNSPYLDNSLVLWAHDAIEAVEKELMKELSSSYRYRADMTPGSVDGVAYDGVMRDIVGNHVALVRDGRAGPDVVVGDSKPNREIQMAKSLLTRRAAAVQGALLAFLTPRLAADAKIDLGPIVAPITTKNFGALKEKIADDVAKLATGKLATDASVDGLAMLLDALESAPLEEAKDGGWSDQLPPDRNANTNPGAGQGGSSGMGSTPGEGSMMGQTAAAVTGGSTGAGAKDGEGGEGDLKQAIIEMLAGKLPDEDIAALMALVEQISGAAAPAAPAAAEEPPAEDEDEDDEAKKLAELQKLEEEKTAMDARLKGMVSKTAMDQALAAERKRALDARAAEAAVRPYIGEMAVAMDSADKIYAHALKALGVDIEGVPAAAFPAMLKMVPLPGSKPAPRADVIAHDAALASDFAKRNPNAAKVMIL